MVMTASDPKADMFCGVKAVTMDEKTRDGRPMFCEELIGTSPVSCGNYLRY